MTSRNFISSRSDDFPAGAFGDWRTGEAGKWHTNGAGGKATAADRKQLEVLKAKRAKEEAARHDQAAKTANEIWTGAKQADAAHPYLAAKGIGAHGIRERNGELIIPVKIGGAITSLQTIAADGEKLFLFGGRRSLPCLRVRGGGSIGRPRPDGTKEILGLWIEQTEGAKFWLRVMNELKNRGVEDVLIAVVDGLKGEGSQRFRRAKLDGMTAGGFPERSPRCFRKPRFRPASIT
jgi:hypothetical protein